MSSYLDQASISPSKELVIDDKLKMIYDPRNFTLFQHYKYSPLFNNMRPDLGRLDSFKWTEKFNMAEKVIVQLFALQIRNVDAFTKRFDERYMCFLKDTFAQMRLFTETKLQLKDGTRVGPYEEVQSKINFYDKIMDKVDKYEMLYPLNEPANKQMAHQAATSVRERQRAVKDRFLREMGVDYSLLK